MFLHLQLFLSHMQVIVKKKAFRYVYVNTNCIFYIHQSGVLAFILQYIQRILLDLRIQHLKT